ncbi:MAG: hypothetical protein Q8N17_02790 [Burkholderiaceae bacterium]|nr:hypothetical protein [Burkholderiaceae bacterium]
MNQSQLVEAVMVAMSKGQADLNTNPAIEEAMRLAELYEYIKPQEYVLPLDAMAGLPSPAFKA